MVLKGQDPADVHRRTLLKSVGVIAGGTVGASGLAAGGSNTTRTNIGYDSLLGRKIALSAADELIYDFAFDALTIELPVGDVVELRGMPGIRYVEADKHVEALDQTLPFGIDRVDAEVAHAQGATGAGADIAIIDTGIDRGHPDLRANLGAGRAFLNGIESGLWNDYNGHGTHCAGIAAAVDNSTGVVGVSPQATLHAVKVLTATGTGSTSDVAAGVEYVGEQGWDVATLSLGGGPSGILRDACDYADSQGVLLVAAAGNTGPCTDCVTYPAAYPFCAAVSATDANDALADFSSQGAAVDLAAPGADIYSTHAGGSYATLSGTSMAAPHVAGAAGQLMADGASCSAAQRTSASPRPRRARDSSTWSGPSSGRPTAMTAIVPVATPMPAATTVFSAASSAGSPDSTRSTVTHDGVSRRCRAPPPPPSANPSRNIHVDDICGQALVLVTETPIYRQISRRGCGDNTHDSDRRELRPAIPDESL